MCNESYILCFKPIKIMIVLNMVVLVILYILGWCFFFRNKDSVINKLLSEMRETEILIRNQNNTRSRTKNIFRDGLSCA